MFDISGEIGKLALMTTEKRPRALLADDHPGLDGDGVRRILRVA
jgi:hypothetical protein